MSRETLLGAFYKYHEHSAWLGCSPWGYCLGLEGGFQPAWGPHGFRASAHCGVALGPCLRPGLFRVRGAQEHLNRQVSPGAGSTSPPAPSLVKLRGTCGSEAWGLSQPQATSPGPGWEEVRAACRQRGAQPFLLSQVAASPPVGLRTLVGHLLVGRLLVGHLRGPCRAL